MESRGWIAGRVVFLPKNIYLIIDVHHLLYSNGSTGLPARQ